MLADNFVELVSTIRRRSTLFDGYFRKDTLCSVVLFLLVFPFAQATVTSWGLLLGIGLSKWHLPAAWLLCLLLTAIVHRNDLIHATGVTSVASLLLVSCMLVSSFFRDGSYDGNFYQFPAAVSIADGWNPIRDFSGFPHETKFAVIHTPKGHWYDVAATYKFWGTMESGNYLNLVLILVAFYVVYSVCRRTFSFSPWVSLMTALAVSMNPIAIVQSQCGYVDGIGSSCLAIFLFSLIGYARSGERWCVPFSVLSCVYFINVKVTYLIFGTILFLALYLAKFLEGKRHPKQLLLVPALVLVLGLPTFVNPYVYNLVNHANPLYPFVTLDDTDRWILADWEKRYQQIGMDMHRDSRFYAFAFSQLLSNKNHWQQPKVISAERFDYSYIIHEQQNAGFGPLFGPLFIMSLLLIPVSNAGRSQLLLLAALLLTIFISPIAINARYMPQAWLVPITIGLFVLENIPSSSIRHGLAMFVLGGLVWNSAMLGTILYIKHATYSVALNRSLHAIAFDPSSSEYEYVDVTKGVWRTAHYFYKVRFRDMINRPLSQAQDGSLTGVENVVLNDADSVFIARQPSKSTTAPQGEGAAPRVPIFFFSLFGYHGSPAFMR